MLRKLDAHVSCKQHAGKKWNVANKLFENVQSSLRHKQLKFVCMKKLREDGIWGMPATIQSRIFHICVMGI
jgi:hypothetical protein